MERCVRESDRVDRRRAQAVWIPREPERRIQDERMVLHRPGSPELCPEKTEIMGA